MSIGTTIASPSPASTAFPLARCSPLNPAFTRHSLNTNNSHSLRPPTNRSHLSNLNRFLEKQSPPLTTHPSIEESATTNHAAAAAADNKSSNTIRHIGSLFNALNLNTIIPSLRNPATEAMSPKSLTQLQHLLNSPRLSPKNTISASWRRLHGSDNWANLLDPLDENLRRELCRYGDLVQAAYHAFHSNPAISSSQNRHVILPDRSYRVTKSLYATASVELPHWLDGVAPWMTQRSSWIGYVAVCDNLQEIQRMGRRDIVISLRGTSTCMEWAENFRAGLIPMEKNIEVDDEEESKVATGFYSLYKTAGEHHRSLSETVVAEIRRLTELYKGEQLSITVTGHSLGAALALFVADEISTCLPQVPPVAVFSFGGPKVGDRAFADRLVAKGVKVLRVVNANDVITRVPGVLPTSDGYVHMGSELRVDSKASPYLRPDADPSCCHDLESYLHLVDGFMGSDCPFRADAKRSLVRLLDQQRSNMKRLYVSHAKELRLDRFEPASPSHVTAGCLASPSAY